METDVMGDEVMANESANEATTCNGEASAIPNTTTNNGHSAQAEVINTTANVNSESITSETESARENVIEIELNLHVSNDNRNEVSIDLDNPSDNCETIRINEQFTELPTNASLTLDENTTDTIPSNDVIDASPVKPRTMRLKLRKVRHAETIDISDDDAEKVVKKRKRTSSNTGSNVTQSDPIVLDSDSEGSEIIDISAEEVLHRFEDDLKDVV